MSALHEMRRFAQRFEAHEWPDGLQLQEQDASYWAARGCGIACLRMILHHYTGRNEPYALLLAEALALGAYCERGWIHAGLAELARRRGLDAEACALGDVGELHAALRDGPIVASVTLGFPEDGRKGGHLVVLCGFDASGPARIEVRDPSSWGEQNRSVPRHRLLASFSGRVIRFARPGAPAPPP